jgi:hypothetical protein
MKTGRQIANKKETPVARLIKWLRNSKRKT